MADLLYSSNWLPMGFAFAYEATGDRWFHELWKDSVIFCLKTQMFSDRTHLDGAWCRAFDMDLKEAYAAPHDVGWQLMPGEQVDCFGNFNGNDDAGYFEKKEIGNS